MPLIQVTQGGPDIEPGVYPVVLVKLEGPRTVQVQRGPKAGQEMELFDWTFAVMGGTYDTTEIQVSSSTASGPKSKMYAFLTALHGGKPPKVGDSFEANDLLGKIALATVSRPDDGWPKIDNLGAMPAAMLAGAVPPPTSPAAPAVETPAAVVGDLPF